MTRVPLGAPAEWPTQTSEILKLEVIKLIQKGAVEQVLDDVEGFYSRIFVVPKPDGSYRPILDLSALNKYLVAPKFKLDNILTVISALYKGAWLANLDLRDAYFHVLIHPQSRRYLRFRVDGKLYQFRALPFGLSLAPYIFTQIVNSVAAYLRTRGVTLITYLDDWLLIADSKTALGHQISLTCQTLSHLGFIINEEKSQLTPARQRVYLGAYLDTELGIASPSDKNITRLVCMVQEIVRSSVVTAQTVLVLLGLMNFCAHLITRGRLRMRPVQYWLLAKWKPSTGSLQDTLLVDSTLRASLRWWSRDNLRKGIVLFPEEPIRMVQSDASSTGWGAVLDNGQVGAGVWNTSELPLHINLLELRALFRALKHFREELTDTTVLCQVDNSTVVSYLRKEGGTRSPQLCVLVWEMLHWCDAHQIRIKVRHLPGRMNLVSDSLSRGVTPTEWSIHPQVTRAMFKVWGSPMIDLFATSQNFKLPLYYSPQPDPASLGVDSLSQSWAGMYGYAFPPCPILPLVLKKVAQSRSCKIILIAPFWPKRSWYTLLLQLLIAPALQIPAMPRLLYQNGRYHSNPKLFQYHAWLISSDRELRRDFLRKQPVMQGSASESLLEQYIPVDGQSSVVGVLNDRLIRSRSLRLN